MTPPSVRLCSTILKQLHASGVVVIAFGPDGTHAASAGVDKASGDKVGGLLDAFLDGLDAGTLEPSVHHPPKSAERRQSEKARPPKATSGFAADGRHECKRAAAKNAAARRGKPRRYKAGAKS